MALQVEQSAAIASLSFLVGHVALPTSQGGASSREAKPLPTEKSPANSKVHLPHVGWGPVPSTQQVLDKHVPNGCGIRKDIPAMFPVCRALLTRDQYIRQNCSPSTYEASAGLLGGRDVNHSHMSLHTFWS